MATEAVSTHVPSGSPGPSASMGESDSAKPHEALAISISLSSRTYVRASRSCVHIAQFRNNIEKIQAAPQVRNIVVFLL